jgi:hypothetical protein
MEELFTSLAFVMFMLAADVFFMKNLLLSSLFLLELKNPV